MKIAFFDSGIGGLSVLHHAMRVLPNEQFVFYADEDNVPYGVKTKEEVMGFVQQAFDFLVGCDVKAIVVACNTATSVAVREMRHRYDIPIIGMEPAAKKALDLDGEGRGEIDTGIGFFNHMLELLKKHALIDLSVTCRGDLDVDYHHTVEDVGLVFGQALNRALGERRGIARYGFACIPMDEALCETAIDLGGRPFLVFATPKKHLMVRDFEVKLLEEFFRSVSVEGRLNIHAREIYGDETHHVCEGLFKSFARALRQAVAPDPREKGVPSSKGVI